MMTFLVIATVRAKAFKARHDDIFGDSNSEGDNLIEPLAHFK